MIISQYFTSCTMINESKSAVYMQKCHGFVYQFNQSMSVPEAKQRLFTYLIANYLVIIIWTKYISIYETRTEHTKKD